MVSSSTFLFRCELMSSASSTHFLFLLEFPLLLQFKCELLALSNSSEEVPFTETLTPPFAPFTVQVQKG